MKKIAQTQKLPSWYLQFAAVILCPPDTEEICGNCQVPKDLWQSHVVCARI